MNYYKIYRGLIELYIIPYGTENGVAIIINSTGGIKLINTKRNITSFFSYFKKGIHKGGRD